MFMRNGVNSVITFNGDANITTKYTVEFITDAKDYAYVCAGSCKSGEPWERYQEKTFDDHDAALEFFMRGLVDERFLDIRLFEQILVDGVVQREAYIEPPATTRFYLRTTVNKTLEKEVRDLRDKTEQLQNTVDLMRGFIGQFHGATEQLEAYIKEKSEWQ